MKSVYVFVIDLCTCISLEPEGRMMNAEHEDLDTEGPESLPNYMNTFIAQPFRRNFGNETHAWVSLGMIISIVIPNTYESLQCFFTSTI